MRLARFAQRHPYWFAASMEAVVVLVYLIAGTIAYFLRLSNMRLYSLANLGLVLSVVALLTTLRWWKAVGFKSLSHPGDALYFLVLLTPMLLNLIPGVQVESFAHISEAFVVALLVGFAEETIFRGLMLQALKPLGHWRAALLTALLFGLTHALNALTGKSALEAVMQIGYAVAIGFAYAALAVKKNVLWLLILAHFLTDFVYFLQKPGFTLSPFWQSFIVISLAVGFTVSVDPRFIVAAEPRPQVC